MQQVIMRQDLSAHSDVIKSEAMHLIREAQLEGFSNFGGFALLSFDWYDITSAVTEFFRVLIYIDHEHLFYICDDAGAYRYCAEAVGQIDAAYPALTSDQALYRFFIQLFRGDMDYLESIEDQLDATMDAILAGDIAHVQDAIVAHRRELVRLKRYYEQINIVFDDILLDDASFFSQKILDRLSILDSRTDRYDNKVENLQAIVSQMQDTYQAQLSIQQNDLMKVFTIVTAIFLPLTLLVGWYGMNFVNMPELHWRYGYPAVIAFSIIIVAALFWYFKHKKWL